MKNKQQQQYIIYGGIAVVAVAAIVIMFSLSNAGGVSRANADYEQIGFTRTDDGTFVLGNPDAPITIVEFADFMCPYCQEYKSVVDRVIEELVAPGLAKLEFRAYPVLGTNSTIYAQLLECTGELRGGAAFWEAHEELFVHASERRSGDAAGRALANSLDIPYAELLECTTTAQQFNTNLNLGRNTQVQGTPAIRVRYADGSLQPIGSFERAGIPFDELSRIVQAANGQ